jgi:LPXTG-motif cell wall-anchored protein
LTQHSNTATINTLTYPPTNKENKLKNIKRAVVISGIALAAPLATAAVASAHTHIEVCDYEDGTPNITEIWFKTGQQLSNPTGNDSAYGDAGFVVTNKPCPVGAEGPKGEKGEKGNTGAKGEKGDTGAKGEKGDKGETGSPGAPGVGTPGPAGTNGTNGVDGLPGAQGPAGENGAPGVNGVDGLPGVNGTNGVDGAPGAAGAQGPIGADGESFTGPKGVDGADGVPGKNGVTKTVIVHEDGTTETVNNLPGTGGNTTDTALLILGALGLLGVGATLVYTVRRRQYNV